MSGLGGGGEESVGCGGVKGGRGEGSRVNKSLILGLIYLHMSSSSVKGGGGE